MIINKVKDRIKKQLLSLAKRGFHFKHDQFPSIISNDCFGGEIYRSLNIPYNTPFVGLMLMAPCYIHLLKNLEYFINQDLLFIQTSKYDFINELRERNGWFPIGVLNHEVEIHFLHYKSESEAKAKWEARRNRLDLNNLLLKFDFSKDLATNELTTDFLALEFTKKLCIGSSQSKQIILNRSMIDIPEYAIDGTAFFRISLKYIDYKKLLLKGVISPPFFIKGILLSKFLNNTWFNK